MRCGYIPGQRNHGPILDDEGKDTGIEWMIQGGIIVAYIDKPAGGGIRSCEQVAATATSLELLKRVRTYLEERQCT